MKTRLHPARNLWETRLTIENKRKSFYGATPQEAENKAREFLAHSKTVNQVQHDASFRDSLAYVFSVEMFGIYQLKENVNTREKARWQLIVLNNHFGHLPVSTLELAQVLSCWKNVTQAYPKPGSQRTLLAMLGKTMKHLTRSGKIPFNYAEDIPRPKLTKRDDSTIPDNDTAMQFLSRIKGNRLEPKVFLEFVLGLCDEEANLLELSDLKGNALRVRGTKTDYRDRTIYLPDCLVFEMQRFGKGKRTYFIETANGNRYNSNPTRDLRTLAKQVDCPYFSNHCFRHAFATGMQAIGCPETVRMTIMGQSTKNSVQHLYVHPDPATILDWMTKRALALGYLETNVHQSPGVRSGVQSISVPN